MTALNRKYSKYFSDSPTRKFTCPSCEQGLLVPDQSSFKMVEPQHSKNEYKHEGWDPEWIVRRFAYICVCNNSNCTETSHVSGWGSVDQRYDENYEPEFYNRFQINSFYPSPNFIRIPKDAPDKVERRLKKSFALYWVDTSAASNALRASLEALLDDLQIPRSRRNSKGETRRLGLHSRLEIWSQEHTDYAELCIALKEVGNLGSHGDAVQDRHYFGVLEIYQHLLIQLFENNAQKMRELAQKIRSEIKGNPVSQMISIPSSDTANA